MKMDTSPTQLWLKLSQNSKEKEKVSVLDRWLTTSSWELSFAPTWKELNKEKDADQIVVEIPYQFEVNTFPTQLWLQLSQKSKKKESITYP